VKILARTALVAVSIAALGCVSTAAYAAIAPAVLPAGDTIYQSNYSSDPTAPWTTASDAMLLLAAGLGMLLLGAGALGIRRHRRV